MNGNKKKFQINTMTPSYGPEEPSDDMAIRISDYRSGPIFILQIESGAQKKLFEHIDWGKHTSKNSVEQGGILLGRVFKKSERNITYGVVTDIVPGRSAHGSAAYLELSTEVWKEMLDHVDRELEQGGESRNQIIGWYHTHPNSLDVFMSGTDMGTQRRLFANEWHFAIVLNPQRKLWRAFQGPNASECLGGFDSATEKQFARPFVETKESEVKPPQHGDSQTKNMRLEGRTRKNYFWLPLGLIVVLGAGVFFSLNVPSGNFVRKTVNQKPENKPASEILTTQQRDTIHALRPVSKDTEDTFVNALFEIQLNPKNKSAGLQKEPISGRQYTLHTVLPNDTLKVIVNHETWYEVRLGSKAGWVEKKYFSKVLRYQR